MKQTENGDDWAHVLAKQDVLGFDIAVDEIVFLVTRTCGDAKCSPGQPSDFDCFPVTK